MQINTDTMKNYLPIQCGLALAPFVAAKLLFPQIEAVCQVAFIIFAVTGTGTLLAGLCGIDLDKKLEVDEDTPQEDFIDRIMVSIIVHAALALVTALYFGPLAALQYAVLTSASFLPMLAGSSVAEKYMPTWLSGSDSRRGRSRPLAQNSAQVSSCGKSQSPRGGEPAASCMRPSHRRGVSQGGAGQLLWREEERCEDVALPEPVRDTKWGSYDESATS